MASSWFLKLAFKCLHHFAWPLLALVYPMCASIQAIETDSSAKTKDLISYWMLLSLIYLFEYAFMDFLLWFQLWPYIKLMIVLWLIIPDFGRTTYVYNNLIRSTIPQIVTWRLNSYWRDCFAEKDNFLLHAERYMKENGTETLQKLISSKNTMCMPDAEVTNETIDTNSEEILKRNGERLQIEYKDIKDLEATEKIDFPPTKQTTYADIVASQKSSSSIEETKGTAESDTASGELPQSSATPKEVPKKWTCALCIVTTSSEKTLNSHLNGRKHKANCELALKAINLHEEPFRKINSKIICIVCNVLISSEEYMASHLIGKKHLSKIQT